MRRQVSALVCASSVFLIAACSGDTSSGTPSTATSSPAATSKGALSTAPTISGSSVGAAGIGDPYFPSDGNGGYDAQHYDLNVTVEPGLATIEGTSTMVAIATQPLSDFHVDLRRLTVSSVIVNGNASTFTQDG